MQKRVLIITGNKRKAWQAKSCLEPLGISVDTNNLDIDEIQAHDPLKITIAKAHAAYAQLKQPLVVCDHSWAFHTLNGFPGGYMKDMNQWFEAKDWLALMQHKSDRSVTLTEVVAYIDEKNLETFSAHFKGQVIEEARGTGAVSMERVVVFDGSSRTIAEHIDAGEHAREMADSAWNKFGEWYIAQS